MRKARSDRRRHSGDVVRSPVRSTTEAMEPPRTPIQKSTQAYHHLVGSSSPETLCPQPRRLLPDAAMSLMMSGNEEAEQKELMEMFMGHKVTGAHPARVWDCENRPLSSVSTSAGATPSLDEQCRLQFSPAPSSAAPTPTLQEPSERFKTLPPLQAHQTQVRKIFIGGIPQWMTTDDLAAFFSSFGAVSKAWLQRQRADNGSGHGHSSIPVHRGFGFVVFQDPSTVDELLGSDLSASRFMELQDGKRIEVKRAKTSTDMTHEKQTYTADTSFKAAGPSTMETKGQKGQVQSQWQTCTPQHQNQNVSNGNNAVRDASQVLIKQASRTGACELIQEVKKSSSEKIGATEQAASARFEEAESSSEEDCLGPPAEALSEMKLELSPLVSEHPQQSFETYVKRIPELLAAAVETNWEKLQGAAAEHPLGSLVGKLELFWIHEPGDLPPKPAESAMGLVCFQFVQGHASHYARVLHLSVTRPEALQSAVSQARHLILETLPVKSLRVTVLAAEDDGQHICIDPHVERAYHQCGFRWFQLTQKLRRKKSSLLRHRKKRAVRFLVLHSQRGDADPPAPRNEIGTKAQLLLQSQTSEEGRESPSAIRVLAPRTSKEVEPVEAEELTFSAW